MDIQNITTSRDTTIAKVEVQRISAVSRHALGKATEKDFVFICPIRNRSLLLESDQRDSYCFSLTGSTASPAMESSELWLTNQAATEVLPPWPDYAFHLAKPLKSQLRTPPSQLAYLQLAVFWKAQLVYGDGTLSTTTIFGETPIQNPFLSDGSHPSHRVPGTAATLEIIAPKIGAEEYIIERPAPITLGEAAKNVISTLHPSSATITHSFSESRLCSFATRLTVLNLNQTLRDVWVTVNCGPVDSTASNSESGGVASILQAVAAVSSQQALIPHQTVFRAKVAHGASHSFNIRLRATAPSVYDLSSSIRTFVSFDADSERCALHVPPSYVTVLDSRASHGVRAAAALRV
uniref:TMEM132 domain-containing protein n=1 Tax=Steinernema glaseri TaxID=37863 RepID=A0A1I7ZD07_9BILA